MSRCTTRLFRLVPDHPRLTRRADPDRTRAVNQSKLGLIGDLLTPSMVVAEFAPGDCLFATEIARRVKLVYGIDISDQRGDTHRAADNFRLIVYDGFDTEAIAAGSLDLVFSDQLIEHFHPDDAAAHFALAARLLKRGGRYFFRTPHALTGPHDVSAYFSDEPQGFHLKEWTYGELGKVLSAVGFSRSHGYWSAKGRKVRIPIGYFSFCESRLTRLPKTIAQPLARVLVREIMVLVEK